MATTSDERPTETRTPTRTMHVPRTRGALSGVLLLVLGVWGALIPFIGPYFNLSYTPDSAWHWTSARGWLEVLPGVVAAVGGLLSLVSANRAVISVGAWLGVAAGAWFIVGRDLARWWDIGSPGVPAGTSTAVHAVETLVMFTGLGALILFFAASAVGRLSVTSVRDVRVAQRREARAQRRDRSVGQAAYEQGRRDGVAATGTNRAVGQHAVPDDRQEDLPPPGSTTVSGAPTASTTAPPPPPPERPSQPR